MPSSSLFLRSSTTLVSTLLLLSSATSAANTYYALDTEYSGTSFFDGFNFQTTADLSHGFVTYVDKSTASSSGLITFDGGSTQMRVDSVNNYDGNKDYWLINGVGRPSVRIESAKSWTHGLFIADIKHLPTTTTTSGCGTWPAFWTLGDGTWPYHGEIDIIEGANNQATNLAAAHTGNTCTVAQSPLQMTGTSNGNNCQYDVATGTNGAGCAAFDQRTQSWGAGFNQNNGGVYAMEWTSDAIKIWFFPRGAIPSDISSPTSNGPDPSGWGLPSSIFNGPGCDINANFQNHRIVFDTTFCGDFGDATWSNGCSTITSQSKCSVFVGSNPTQFADTFWDINYVRVYQSQQKQATTTTAGTTTSTTRLATTTTTSTTTGGSSSVGPIPATTTTSVPVSTHTTSVAETTTSVPVVSSSSPHGTTTTSFHTFGPFPNTTSTSVLSPVSTESSTWEDWASSTVPVDPITASSSSAWEDWASSSGTPVIPATTVSLSSWDDWTSSTKSVDTATTATTSPATWADWDVITITIATTWVEPCPTGFTTKTTTVVTTHCGCTETPVPTVPVTITTITPSSGWPHSHPVVVTIPAPKPEAPSTAPKPQAPSTAPRPQAPSTAPKPEAPSTAPKPQAPSTAPKPEAPSTALAPASTVTAGPHGDHPVAPVSPVSPASPTGSSGWVSPSVTTATTLYVAPTPASPVAPHAGTGDSTKPYVATFTGAAGRTEMSALATLCAAVVALAFAL